MNFLNVIGNWIANVFKNPQNSIPDKPSAAVSPSVIDVEPLRPSRPILEVIKAISRDVYKSVLVEHVSVANPQQLKSLIELGVSTVRNHWRGPFNPAQNAADAELQKELEVAEAAVVAARNDEGRARNNQRQSRLAAPPKKLKRPSLPTPIIFAGIGGFTTLFTFTFIELPMLTAIDDMRARILFAAIPGLVFATIVVFAGFHVRTKDDSAAVIFTKASFREMTWQAMSGLGLIAGMGIVRFAVTSGFSQQILSVGLMLVEGALWIYVKTASTRNSEIQDEYDLRTEADPRLERHAELWDQYWHEDDQALKTALAKYAVVKKKMQWRLEQDFDLEAMLRLVAAEIQNAYMTALGQIRGRGVIGDVVRDFDFRFRSRPDDDDTAHVN